MVISELFAKEEKKSRNEFFDIPSNVQNYFNLKKKEEQLGKDIAKRIIDKISNNNENKK